MSMTFSSVNKEQLQQAFALAHQASEDGSLPLKVRRKFSAIANLIWRAHGERGAEAPRGAGRKLIEAGALDQVFDPELINEMDRVAEYHRGEGGA